MATAYTNVSAIGLYYSGQDGASDFQAQSGSIGGARTARMLTPITPMISTPIPPLVVHAVYGPEGYGYITVTDTDKVTYTAPDDTEGAAVEITSGQTKLVESDDTDYAVIIERDAEYAGDDIGGRMELDCRKATNNLLGMSNVSAADAASGIDTYRSCHIFNHTDSVLEDVVVSVRSTLGTQVTSDTAQLGASGAGTIESSVAFAEETPAMGWALIRTSANVIREVVYYEERTDTELTVTADGRGLLGTTAAAGAASDKIDFIPGIRLAIIAPGGDGMLEEIADENTAPTVAAWVTAGTTLTIDAIQPGESYGLWIHREIPPGCVAGRYETRIGISWDGYLQVYRGYYWVSDGLEIYALATAEGEMPTDVVDANTVLPLTFALTPPGSGTYTYWNVCVLRNEYGLTSQNKYPTKITIDDAGDDVGSALAVPESVELLSLTGGYLMLRARYSVALDATPATYWRAYVTTDGVDPDITTDTPTAYAMSTNPNGPQYQLEQVIGPYEYGATIKAVVTAYRPLAGIVPEAESDASAVASVAITTVAPVNIAGDVFLGYAGAQTINDPVLNTTTYYDSPTNSVGVRVLPGEQHIIVNGEAALRVAWPNEDVATVYLHDDWSLVYGAVSGAAGVADVPLDPASSTLAYIVVNGQRVVSLNQGTQTITYSGDLVLDGTAPTADITSDVAHMTDTETLFLVPNPRTGKHATWMSVDTSGTITISATLKQDIG